MPHSTFQGPPPVQYLVTLLPVIFEADFHRLPPSELCQLLRIRVSTQPSVAEDVEAPWTQLHFITSGDYLLENERRRQKLIDLGAPEWQIFTTLTRWRIDLSEDIAPDHAITQDLMDINALTFIGCYDEPRPLLAVWIKFERDVTSGPSSDGEYAWKFFSLVSPLDVDSSWSPSFERAVYKAHQARAQPETSYWDGYDDNPAGTMSNDGPLDHTEDFTKTHPIEARAAHIEYEGPLLDSLKGVYKLWRSARPDLAASEASAAFIDHAKRACSGES